MMRPFSAVNISEMFDSWVGRFELDLEAAGRSPRINITAEIVAPLGHCLGYGVGSGMLYLSRNVSFSIYMPKNVYIVILVQMEFQHFESLKMALKVGHTSYIIPKQLCIGD